MPIDLVIGPPTQNMSRIAAEQALARNPELPRDAEFKVEAIGGHWVAAVHTAGPPPPEGAPADTDEESAGPKSEGPDDIAPSGDEGPPSDDGGDSSKPPHEKGEGGKGGEHQLLELLTAIADALGIPTGGGGMVPGADAGLGPDAGMGGPPMGGPPAPPHGGPPVPPHGGPPGGPPMGPGGPGGAGANQHVIHEKSGPPMPPTFASVPDDHPWKDAVGKVAHFRIASAIGETSMPEVERELSAIAAAGGFGIKRLQESRGDNGERIAEAIISTPRQ